MCRAPNLFIRATPWTVKQDFISLCVFEAEAWRGTGMPTATRVNCVLVIDTLSYHCQFTINLKNEKKLTCWLSSTKWQWQFCTKSCYLSPGWNMLHTNILFSSSTAWDSNEQIFPVKVIALLWIHRGQQRLFYNSNLLINDVSQATAKEKQYSIFGAFSVCCKIAVSVHSCLFEAGNKYDKI